MHDQSEIVFEGDSKDQVVIGSSPAGHDDDAENGGVIYGSAKLNIRRMMQWWGRRLNLMLLISVQLAIRIL